MKVKFELAIQFSPLRFTFMRVSLCGSFLTWGGVKGRGQFSFAILYFCLQKAHNFFSILSFSFAILYFLLQYFNCLANIYALF